ncbi:sodium ABC transporter permease [Enterococcus mundtii]|uniref:ABC transporter permease n=1 Tax=Enterococcus mundtii TaxID=53346 RepID=UPI000D358125|nr:ABC transporter permease [Enterococcus mundtii]PTO38538.1 sodium ABC transporter permease [Enterococcus mundtii]PTO43908.1 sodium ABC transporter permease [Enterococcus mundtii]
MHKFWIITKDVYWKNVKTLSFLIMILVPFITMGITYVASTFAQQSGEINRVGIVADNEEISQYLAQIKTDDFEFEVMASEQEGEKKLAEEQLDAYMIVVTENNTVSGELFSQDSLGQVTQLMIQQQLNGIQSMLRANSLGVTPEEVAQLSEQANFSRQKVSFDEDGAMVIGEDHTRVQNVVSTVVSIFLLLIIMTYSQIIAQEIASEKGTRIMEVILSSTTAQKHFYGKLTGILLVALTQMGLYGIIFGFGYTQFKDMDIVQAFLEEVSLDMFFGPFLWYTLVFMILGILIYSILAALCGSLVNKAEDTAKAIVPVTYLSFGGYGLGLSLAVIDPSNIVLRITSYVPFLSSYIMPIRLANETAQTTEVWISLVILFVATLGLMFFSATMYKSNVLVYSEGGIWSSLKQSISIMRNEKNKQ